ncbi:MAG: hypothetical protein ACKVQJ_01590 [Pyrinomonadaceae bacterium]
MDPGSDKTYGVGGVGLFDVGGGVPGGDGAGVAGAEVWDHVADGAF